MSAIDVRALSSVPVEPWRNGGGVTQTLATHGTEWRVSVAQVERDGPYSRFDSIARVSFLLRGKGVTLRHRASVIRLAPLTAVEYDGGTEWDATLVDGPVTALNIMTAAGRYRTTVNPIVVATIVPPGCAAIVIALDSACRYSEPDIGTDGSIQPGQFMIVISVDRPLRVEPAHHGAAPPLIVTIEPVPARTPDSNF
ncbi:HutD family protein [Trinickia sp. EG282A]|uniref:HutD family protein n=1 Tax=Trinickia sp. EG282A TaxID=3237013 RepID=UPI0034D2BBBB